MKPTTGVDTTTNTPGRQTFVRDGAVLPFYFGRARVAAIPITPVLHWTFRETSRTNYAFFSCLFELAHGPADEIIEIIVNGKPYNGVFQRRDENPGDYIEHVLNKETPEIFRFYWGTETQSGITAYAQSLIRQASHPEFGKTHPNYYGRTIMGVRDLEAGQVFNGVTPPIPHIEIVLYRRSPTAYSFGHTPHGTNAIGAIRDILGDKRGGLGLSDSFFDAGHWEDAMQRLFDDGAAGKAGEDLFISPVIADERDASQVIADALSYFDGMLRQRNGKIEIDWYPNDGSANNPAGLRELSWHDMVAEPQIDSEGEENLVTHVAVTGLDRDAPDAALSEATEIAQVPYAREIIGEPRTEKVDRPWLVTRAQLRAYAATLAVIRSTPAFRPSKITVRRESATHPDGVTPLRPGDRFNLDYTPLALDIVCRITERLERDDKAEVELTFEKERGASPQPYVPPLDPRTTNEQPDPLGTQNAAVVAAPSGLELAGEPTVVVFPERQNTYTNRWRLHFSPNDTFPGEVVLAGGTWAISGIVQTQLAQSAAPGTLRLAITSAEIARYFSQSASQQENNTMFAYAGGEWLSIGTITPITPNVYDLAVLRARVGSAARTINAAERVYIAFAAELLFVTHRNFRVVGTPYNPVTATKYFKVQGYSGVKDAPMPVGSIALQFPDRAPGAPINLTAYGEPNAVACQWTNSGDSDLARTDVWVRTAAAPVPALTDPPDFTQFAAPGIATGLFRVGNLAPTTVRYFWARHVDTTGLSSTITGPQSAAALAAAQGPAGQNGTSTREVYRRSRFIQTAPIGNNPVDWSFTIPDGQDPLWVSTGTFDSNGNLVGVWSTPRRLSGTILLYENHFPVGDWFVGDTIFRIDQGFDSYKWTGSAWESTLNARVPTLETGLSNEITARQNAVAAETLARIDADDDLAAAITTEATARQNADGSLAAEYVLQVVAGNRIAGFRVTNQGGGGGGSDFVIQADNFYFVDTSGGSFTKPFYISGGQAFIDEATIPQLNAGKIDAGVINAAISLGSAGSLTSGTGANRFAVDTGGTIFGDPSGVNFAFINSGGSANFLMRNGGSIESFLSFTGGSATLDLGGGTLQQVGTVNASNLRALSGANPRGSGAPLSTQGGAWIGADLDVMGLIDCNGSGSFGGNLQANTLENTNIDLNNAAKCNLQCGEAGFSGGSTPNLYVTMRINGQQFRLWADYPA